MTGVPSHTVHWYWNVLANGRLVQVLSAQYTGYRERAN